MASPSRDTRTMQASAVLLDWDDTMVASTVDQYNALYKAFDEFGAEYLDIYPLLHDFKLKNFRFYKFHADPKDNLSDFRKLIEYLVLKYWMPSNLSGQEKLQEEIAEILLKEMYEPIRKETSMHPKLLEGAYETILALEEKGIPVGIISSKVHDDLLEGIKNTQVGSHFQLVPLNEFGRPMADKACGNIGGTTVYVLGSYRNRGWPRKPNPLQYLQMMAAMEVWGDAGRVWSIGDIPEHDIQPIQKLGCEGIVFGKQFDKEAVDDACPPGYKGRIIYTRDMPGLRKASSHKELRKKLQAEMTKAPGTQSARGTQRRDIWDIIPRPDAASQTGEAGDMLAAAIERDARSMIKIMQKNKKTDERIEVPELGVQVQNLTNYLYRALERIGVSKDELEPEHLAALAEYIYAPGQNDEEAGHVYGVVNAIYEELLRSPAVARSFTQRSDEPGQGRAI